MRVKVERMGASRSGEIKVKREEDCCNNGWLRRLATVVKRGRNAGGGKPDRG
jgi:hypothetical protein